MDQSEVEGISNQKVANPTVAVQGGRALWHNKQQQANITFIPHLILDSRFSLLGDVTSSPAAEHLNDANIEDMWVPHVLWLWTAHRIRYRTDSEQLKQT